MPEPSVDEILRETIEELKNELKVSLSIAGVNKRSMAIKNSLDFIQSYLSISEQCPKAIREDLTDIEDEFERGMEEGRAKGYNAARKDMIMWLEKRCSVERLERIIAEFIPHKDNQYIKPLAEAIRSEIVGGINE